MDILLAIASLLLAIGIVAMLGAGLPQVMIAVGVATVPIFARLLRGTILGQREADYVLAARSIGVLQEDHPHEPHPSQLHLAGDLAGTLAMATAIIDVAGLGFLGLGPQTPPPRSGERC